LTAAPAMLPAPSIFEVVMVPLTAGFIPGMEVSR
jgi:hypothetical protein